ncbi:hypothetical protein ACWKWU_06040 [Chitinophaga lutea]
MNWKNSTIFSVSLATLLLSGAAYVWSCGPEPDPYDYYANFYNPDISANKGFSPFYYTGLKFYYAVEPPDEIQNVQLWRQFFGNEVTEKDIREFVYTYPRPQMSALYNHIEKGAALNGPDSLLRNTLTKHFIRTKDRETLGYLMYAKQCEPYLTGPQYSWDPAPLRDSAAMMRLSRNGMQLYRVCKDDKVRERYAFQVTRLAHYCRNYDQALKYYDTLAAPFTQPSLFYYKSLALKAGALMRTGRKAESAYLFSRVFAEAPSQRKMAYQNTLWTGADKSEVYRLCRNNAEKATVAALFAATESAPYAEGLRETYRFDPQSPLLDLLLSREITKLEEEYLTPQLMAQSGLEHYYWWSNEPSNDQPVKALRGLLDTISAGKVKEPGLWQTSSAYLSYMLRDYTGAQSRLKAAKPGLGREAVKDQWEIVRILTLVAEKPKMDKAMESQLLETFHWLDGKIAGGVDSRYYSYGDDYGIQESQVSKAFYIRMYRNLADRVLAARYEQQGDFVRAGMLYSLRDQIEAYTFYWGVSAEAHLRDTMTNASLVQLYDLTQQKRKSPFEEYLYGKLALTDSGLGRAVAVSYARIHDFSRAADWFARHGSDKADSILFNPQLQDYDASEGPLLPMLSQLDWAKEMAALQKKVTGSKATAEDCFRYATGLFSVSYYGHSNYLLNEYRPTTRWYSPDTEKRPDLREYYGCYEAEKYYAKAAALSSDPEFKARSLFMAARCAQKHLWKEGEEWWLSATENPYFGPLVKDLSQTAFFRQVDGQCGYLRDYQAARRAGK